MRLGDRLKLKPNPRKLFIPMDFELGTVDDQGEKCECHICFLASLHGCTLKAFLSGVSRGQALGSEVRRFQSWCHAASPSDSGMYRHHRPIPSRRIQDFLIYNKTEMMYLQDKISHLLKTSGLKQTNHLASPVHCINCTGLRVGQWRLERLYRFVHPCLGFEGPSCTLTWVLIRSQSTPRNPEVTKWGTFLDCFR